MNKFRQNDLHCSELASISACLQLAVPLLQFSKHNVKRRKNVENC